jgi:chemotaxis protein MotB
MALKKPEAPAGAPAWIVTYGDMMSLLLCFFVLLAAMANFDEDEKLMMTALESIREALGSPGQKGWMPDKSVDFKSLILSLQAMHIPNMPSNYGYSDQASSVGKQYKVRKIRDGLEVTIGGRIAFEKNEAKPGPATDALLTQIAEKIRGYRNRVEIRGHTHGEPDESGGPFNDAIELSFARARAVRERLMAAGVEPERLRVVAVGPFEPVIKEAVTESQQAENRRVEILVLQSTVEDYKKFAVEGAASQPADEDASQPGEDVPTTQPDQGEPR